MIQIARTLQAMLAVTLLLLLLLCLLPGLVFGTLWWMLQAGFFVAYDLSDGLFDSYQNWMRSLRRKD